MPKKWLNRNVAAMGATSMLSDTSHEMATAVLPSFLTQLVGSSAPQFLGLITGISDALSSFVKMFSGWVSDKMKKRKPLMMMGYFITGFFIGLIGFARNWIDVLLCRTIGWIGRGTREPARDALLAESVNKKFYGRVFGFHRAMDTLGAILGPLLAMILIPLIGFRNIFFASLIPGILAFLVVFAFIKEKPKKIKKTKGLIGQIKLLPKKFQLFMLIISIFGIANFNKTFLLLKVQESLSPSLGLILAGTLAVLFYTIRNVAQAFADYFVGALGDKFDKGALLSILGFLLFGLMSLGFAINLSNIFYFIFLFILSGASAAAFTTLEKAYAAELLPANMRGTGYGIMHTIDGIGDFISSFIVGTLWVVSSSSVAFIYGAVMSFAAAIIFFALMKR